MWIPRDLVVILVLSSTGPAVAQFGVYQPVDGCAAQHVQACDIDGDGDQDLLVTKEDGLQWYRNLDGQGGFGPHHVILPQPPNTRLMVRPGDVDGDGDTDLVMARDTDSTLFLLANLNGLGSFGPPQAIATMPARPLPRGFTALHLADLSGDGLPEVLALFGGHNTVFRCTNTGGAFSPLETLPDVLPGIGSGLFAVGDLDTDGDADLLLHDIEGHYVVAENSAGDGSAWTALNAFTALSDVEHDAALLDIDGDGDLDIGLHGPVRGRHLPCCRSPRGARPVKRPSAVRAAVSRPRSCSSPTTLAHRHAGGNCAAASSDRHRPSTSPTC